ncbi:MAG: hypothetical protein EXS05_09515 [Planctomycetaceae bacterium]|nr:hypothetical protein [Planctomycetaceae bacterium]
MIGVANNVTVALRGVKVLDDVPEVYQQFGIPTDLVAWTVFLSCLACGPICLFLGNLALKDIKQHPGLRGEFLARLAVFTGLAGILGTIVFVGGLMAAAWLG